MVLAIVVAWLFTRFLLYPQLGVPDNAPMLLRPVAGFLLAWYLLHAAGERWSALGLARPRNLALALVFTFALYAVIHLASVHVVPHLARAFSAAPSPPFLAYIRGNTVAFVGWVAIAWIVGGLVEELLFRGFLLDRISALAGRGMPGLACGVAGQAVLFGLLHLYQGAFGFVFAGFFALIYGIAYLLLGRNLWPLILVHGAWNTVAITGLYAR